jgi:predicted transcriptional regulator of viral defense system
MDDPAPSRASSYIAPLSSRERALLADWERARKTRLTRDELVAEWGPSVASDITKGLVRKGVLRRIAQGIYWVVPMHAQSRPTEISAPVAVAAILADAPYYLGGLWAFTYHHLTQQLYTSAIDAFVAQRRRNRRLANAEIRFHVIPEESLSVGTEPAHLEGVTVVVSSPERTLLDALDYPDSVGGLRAGVKLVASALNRVDDARLIPLAAGHSRVSTCQRLGVLLERAKVARSALAPLRRRIRENHSVVSLLPDNPRHGRVHPDWRVVENDA